MAKKQDKWDKLLKLFDEEDFCVDDLLACICAQLSRNPKDEYGTTLMCGGKMFNITINKREIQ